MTINLSQSEFSRIRQIVQNLPNFKDFDSRRELVETVFQDLPQANLIFARLNLEGSPMLVAVEVVSFLLKFGQLDNGKEALYIFLTHISPLTQSDDKDFINGLFPENISQGNELKNLSSYQVKTTEVEYCSKVLLFQQVEQEEICIAIQGSIPPDTVESAPGTFFTIGFNVLEKFNPVGCTYEVLESIHMIIEMGCLKT